MKLDDAIIHGFSIEVSIKSTTIEIMYSLHAALWRCGSGRKCLIKIALQDVCNSAVTRAKEEYNIYFTVNPSIFTAFLEQSSFSLLYFELQDRWCIINIVRSDKVHVEII